MAKLYLGYNVNSDYSPEKVTSGSSTTGKDVELVVNLASFDNKTITREQISVIVDAFERILGDTRDFGLPS